MANKASVLEDILNKVYEAKDLTTAKEIVKARLEAVGTAIGAHDKHVILVKANACSTLIKLQEYITNSYFKFKKMGLR